jgi:hypothetical protein
MKTSLIAENSRFYDRPIPAMANRVMIDGLLWHGKAKK